MDMNNGVWREYVEWELPDSIKDKMDGYIEHYSGSSFYVYFVKDGEKEEPLFCIGTAFMHNQKYVVQVFSMSDKVNKYFCDVIDIMHSKIDSLCGNLYDDIFKDISKLEACINNNSDDVDDLRFLYEIDRENSYKNWLITDEYYADKVRNIIDNRDWRFDLARVFNCSIDKISNDKNDIYDGKDIVCYYGDLGSLDEIKLFSNRGVVKLPENIIGYFIFKKNKVDKNVIFPKFIRGDMILLSKNVKDVVFPERVKSFTSNFLEGCMNVYFPRFVENEFCINVNWAKNVRLPERAGSVKIGKLMNPYGLTFSKENKYKLFEADSFLEREKLRIRTKTRCM